MGDWTRCLAAGDALVPWPGVRRRRSSITRFLTLGWATSSGPSRWRGVPSSVVTRESSRYRVESRKMRSARWTCGPSSSPRCGYQKVPRWDALDDVLVPRSHAQI